MTLQSRIFISLGSNVGHRENYLSRAIVELEKSDIMPVSQSSVYLTDAWGLQDQVPFLNQVVEVSSELTPEQLLRELKSIEERMGRQFRKKWGAREIDLDILYFGNRILDSDTLKIPHAFVRERNFVLVPLHEIAPDFIDPQTGKTIREVLDSNTDDSSVSVFNPIE